MYEVTATDKIEAGSPLSSTQSQQNDTFNKVSMTHIYTIPLPTQPSPIYNTNQFYNIFIIFLSNLNKLKFLLRTTGLRQEKTGSLLGHPQSFRKWDQ